MGPGHQLVDAGCRPEVDELGQRVSEPGMWVHGIEFACLDERSDDCAIGPAFISCQLTVRSCD